VLAALGVLQGASTAEIAKATFGGDGRTPPRGTVPRTGAPE